MGGELIGLVAVILGMGVPLGALYTYYRVRKLRSEERLAAIARGVEIPVEPELSQAARSRRSGILLVSGVLYTIAGLRDFRPSIFGKANTFSQLAAVVFVILLQIDHSRWVWIARTVALRATFMFTIVSGLHYVYLVGQRLHAPGAHSHS